MNISYNSRRVILRWLVEALNFNTFLTHVLNKRLTYGRIYSGAYRLVFYDGSFLYPSVPVRAVLERERGYKSGRW